MASGGYVLAAVITEGPQAGRHLFCCRELEASRVVPEMVPYHVEFATAQEAQKFIETNGTNGQWVHTPQ